MIIKSGKKIIASGSYGKLGCVERMVVDSILPHAECGPNDHRKDAPPFMNQLVFDVLGDNEAWFDNKPEP